MVHELNFIEVEVERGETITTRLEKVMQIVEALLFSTSEPIPVAKMRQIISSAYPLSTQELRAVVDELAKSYVKEKKGFEIAKIAEGYVLRSVREMRPFVEQLHKEKRPDRLSRPALEVLAIVAHHQPITKAKIDAIRGVDSSGVISSLVERDLIVGVGRAQSLGRPMQYGASKRFLHHFGLNSVKELHERDDSSS